MLMSKHRKTVGIVLKEEREFWDNALERQRDCALSRKWDDALCSDKRSLT